MEEKKYFKTYKSKTVMADSRPTEWLRGSFRRVQYGDEEKTLKWCHPNEIGNDPQALYQNIISNIRQSPPDGPFLWPQDVLMDENDGTIGYIMDLLPEGYHRMTDFLYQKEGAVFASYGTALDAGIQIAAAFIQLHRKKYSYQSLDTDNILIHPQDGRVLFTGNEFAVLNDAGGKNKRDNRWALPDLRYMAPEIIKYKWKMADTNSDRYTLAVLLFLLIFLKHPLEGKHSLVPLLTPELEKELYVTEPSFLMDTANEENGPDRVIHKNVVDLWNRLPEDIRNLFLDAFSSRAFQSPSLRPKEAAWLDSLIRLRSGAARCSCGKEVFLSDGRSADCNSCNKRLLAPFTLQLREYSIPGAAGRKIFWCQLEACDWETCNIDRALETVGHIVANKSDNRLLGLKNMTDKVWRVRVPQDDAENEKWYVQAGGGLRRVSEETRVQPKAVITLKNDLTIIQTGRMKLGSGFWGYQANTDAEPEIVIRKNILS